jgi:uncharacterized protein YqeY
MLEEKILNDYKGAMKSREITKSSVLSFLRAEILNAAVAKKKNALDDAEVMAVIRKQIKAHQDSIDLFQKGDRLDLVEKEKAELVVLEAYLPPQMTEGQLKQLIEEVVASTQAQGIKDMGKVIKEVNVKAAGSADGKLVSDLVRLRLTR